MAGIAQVFLTLNERLERLVTRVDHLFVQSESRKGDPGRDAQALALSKQNLAGLARRIDLIEEQHKKLQDSVDKLIAVCEGMEKVCEGMRACLLDYKPRTHRLSKRSSVVYTSPLQS
ncbi:hypothetical protein MPTK1_6g07800 [Marchantia polymorpha subsp. ruderalis]|uniref:Uncharacterized protein n=2 Tax=Marchantia polymorpha TaxID=3197 RepID=A0AAF6BPN4_MARPO|nr:hypothetical protein MARPO_0053s0093 [Marchantia polymorpha]BBN13968.1 hypothetical protein Mp_6g07800 [Marchantia polymorpha subsp. ruderalis]|eukprot:PTQ38169.1 hypothetical protein MARPO_0053s0093 [Marchantia polymorpha]